MLYDLLNFNHSPRILHDRQVCRLLLIALTCGSWGLLASGLSSVCSRGSARSRGGQPQAPLDGPVWPVAAASTQSSGGRMHMCSVVVCPKTRDGLARSGDSVGSLNLLEAQGAGGICPIWAGPPGYRSMFGLHRDSEESPGHTGSHGRARLHVGTRPR